MSQTKVEDPLKHAIETEDVQALCKVFFDVDLYPTQEEIVRDIAFQRERKLLLNCYTRYGKTFAVGVGLALYQILDGPNLDDFRIGIVGPTSGDANRVRKEMLKAGINSEEFASMIDTSRGSDAEDLVKSRSKEMLTFNEGDIELQTVSASSGKSGDGKGAMGDGFDVVIMDESNRVSHSFWKESGDRLLEHEDSVLIEMGNPWHKDNQFYRHFTYSDTKVFHVGEHDYSKYMDNVPENMVTASGLEEGRHSKQWFDEKAKERGGRESIEYKVLFQSVFPDQVDDALIAHSWLERAEKNSFSFEDPEIVYAIDVAGEGTDKLVVTRVEKESGKYRLTDQWARDKSSDTGETAHWADSKVSESREDVDRFVVDAVGIGAGVHSKLQELGYEAVKFKAGEKPRSETDRFQNKKARNFFKLRDVLQENDLELVKGFRNGRGNKLVHELTHICTERRARDKVRIVDPDSGSPDFADSLMMCFFEGSKAFVM